MSTRFEALTQRIQELPERHRRSGQVLKLTRYASDIRTLAEELRLHTETERELRAIFPAATLHQVATAAAQAARHGSRLKAVLTSDSDSVESTQVDDLIVKLKGQAQAARSAVRNEWRVQLGLVITRYQKLIAAASKGQLEGAKSLAAAMTRIELRAASDPAPGSATGIRSDLQLLSASVKELKLEGKGGRFLETVVENRGDPRALFDEEVRAFIDAHNLWSTIAVVFG